VTIAPNGDLLVVCNDSGFVFKVNSVAPPHLPADLHPTQRAADGLHLGWTGLLGHAYVVERTADLLPATGR
jgi:hypothetical protein